MDNVIEATGLTKYYGDFPAVDHISFEVKKGEIFGFLHPNDEGKTTTIRLLTGQTRPTLGSLTVAGRDVIEIYLGEVFLKALPVWTLGSRLISFS